MKENIKQPWFIRKAAYALVGVVLLVLAAFGLLDEGQIDAIAASPILGAAVAFFASTRTHSGSDSTATAADVAAAKVDPADIARQILEGFEPAGRHALNETRKAAQTVADHYANQRP